MWTKKPDRPPDRLPGVLQTLQMKNFLGDAAFFALTHLLISNNNLKSVHKMFPGL
jgi:hypothetical protein